MIDLRGKVVLVTGAAHGIGLETARAFAREGARVVLADIHLQRLEDAVRVLREAGHNAEGIQADLRTREQVYRMVDRAVETAGRVDVLVNNAGVVFARRIWEIGDEEIEDTVNVNLLAPIWATRRALVGMIERGAGHIVNIASAGGKITNSYISVYCATKFAVVGFTDAIHQELHGTGVGTTAVNPGWISSGMFKGARRIPFTRWKPPRFIAESIVFAVQRDKAEIHRPRLMWFGGILRAVLGPKAMAFLWRLFRADRLFANVRGYEQL
jgi:all-trans-retinol dehydrogenase (NAD+)